MTGNRKTKEQLIIEPEPTSSLQTYNVFEKTQVYKAGKDKQINYVADFSTKGIEKSAT